MGENPLYENVFVKNLKNNIFLIRACFFNFISVRFFFINYVLK